MKNLAYKFKLRHAGLLVIWLLTSVSCERPFLEPWPPDGARLPSDIWENYNFSRGILFKAMADHQYPYIFYTVTGPSMLASACDEAEHTETQAMVQSFNDGSWSPTRDIALRYGGTVNNDTKSPWYNSYSGLRRVNIFLANVDNSAIINDPTIPSRFYERDYFKGAAYYLRAFLYFELFRAYGTFVIQNDILTMGDNMALPRNTMQECYDTIIADLDRAIELVPYLHDDLNWSMPNKTMAQTLKAVVQLYYASPLFQGEDREANPYGIAKNTVGDVDRWLDVVSSSRAAIQENAFYNLMPMTRWNKSYSTTGSYSERLTVQNGASQSEAIMATTFEPSTYYNEYNSLPDNVELCNGLTNPSQNLVDAFEVVPLQTAGTIGRPVVGAPAVPFDWTNAAHAANPYANRDPRFYFSVSYNGTAWGETPSLSYIVDTYEAVSPNPGGKHRDYTRPNHTKTGYYYRKFIPETFHNYGSSSGYTGFSRIVPHIRFAELLLIYAEAMNEAYGADIADPSGPLRAITTIGATTRTPSTAREAVNCIRERVGMPEIPVGLTQDQMREVIKHERQVEFAFENKRFWDLRRWKMGDVLGEPIRGIKVTPTAFNTAVPPRPTAFAYEVEEVETRFWDDRMYFFPIPYGELIKYNGAIKQNPGW